MILREQFYPSDRKIGDLSDYVETTIGRCLALNPRAVGFPAIDLKDPVIRAKIQGSSVLNSKSSKKLNG